MFAFFYVSLRVLFGDDEREVITWSCFNYNLHFIDFSQLMTRHTLDVAV